MVKAVIFDLDGTLLNTLGDIHAVLNASLEKFSLPIVSPERVKKFVGNGALKLVERAVGECDGELLAQVFADYSKNFAECENNLTSLYDGADKTLERLKSAGVKLAIITNKPQDATERVYEKFLSRYRFDAVVGKSDGTPLKPDPKTTLEIIESFGVKRGECLFVGDGETDVLTAKNAGVKCVSVLWGFRSKKELAGAGAGAFASSFKELENYVFGM